MGQAGFLLKGLPGKQCFQTPFACWEGEGASCFQSVGATAKKALILVDGFPSGWLPGGPSLGWIWQDGPLTLGKEAPTGNLVPNYEGLPR